MNPYRKLTTTTLVPLPLVAAALVFSPTMLLPRGVMLVNADTTVSYMWMGGQKFANESMTDSSPGSRSGSSAWQDKNVVWFFGGRGFQNKNPPSLMNDLWKHDLFDHSWSRIVQSSHKNLSNNQSSDERTALPQSRQFPVMCGVHNRTQHFLIIFGGIDEDDNPLDDTWMFSFKEEKWLHIEPNKSPLPRGDPAFWCLEDHLVIFGGIGENDVLQDQWVLTYNNFTWIEVPQSEELKNTPGVFYTGNPEYPAGRSGATTWRYDDILYMFGGDIMSNNIKSTQSFVGYTSDLWSYSIKSMKWKFLSGHRQPRELGSFSWYAKPLAENLPSCRRRGAAWVDTNGDLWLFGGQGINTRMPQNTQVATFLSDLWIFRRKTKVWVLYGGIFRHESHYSEKKVWGTHYFPSGRSDMVSWKHENTSVFGFYGGHGFDSVGSVGYLDDMWMMDVKSVLLPQMIAGTGFVLLVVFIAISSLMILVALQLYIRRFHKYDDASGQKYQSLQSHNDLIY